MPKLVVEFSDLVENDIELIGKKAEILYALIQLGIPIPDGFVITSLFFNEFLQKTGILPEIKNIRNSTHPALRESLPKLFEPIQKKIMRTHIPRHLASELHSFYRKLAGVFKEQLLNIYSSTKENKSIAFYDILGDANLILKIKTLLTYYLDQPFSVIVQKTVSKDRKSVVTNETFISNQNLLELAKRIQKHFYFPQEIDYVMKKGKIYVTGIKPFTGTVDQTQERIQLVQKLRKILIKGVSVNPGIVTGCVRVFRGQDFTQIKSSEIIVLSKLNTSMYREIKKAKAIIVDTAFPRNNDKMVYRKLIQIPTVQDTKNATKILRTGNIITVNAVNGEIYQGGLI